MPEWLEDSAVKELHVDGNPLIAKPYWLDDDGEDWDDDDDD